MSERQDYERLGCVEFGSELIMSCDLDPVYVAVRHGKLRDHAQLCRLLVAYWCLYNLGAAARLSELSEKKFWEFLGGAASNTDLTGRVLPEHAGNRWPRGTERRHWRGDQAIASFYSVRERARDNAEALVDWLGAGETFLEVLKRVRQLKGFGPWIGFKVADMLERVAGYDVSFADCELAFYDEPRRGAALYLTSIKQAGKASADNFVDVAVKHLLHESRLGAYRAPPLLMGKRRRINVQEVETVLCKWKSHLGGHYAVGKDTREVYHGLVGWGDAAEGMRAVVRKLKHAPN
jgi:hypothetical protein